MAFEKLVDTEKSRQAYARAAELEAAAREQAAPGQPAGPAAPVVPAAQASPALAVSTIPTSAAPTPVSAALQPASSAPAAPLVETPSIVAVPATAPAPITLTGPEGAIDIGDHAAAINLALERMPYELPAAGAAELDTGYSPQSSLMPLTSAMPLTAPAIAMPSSPILTAVVMPLQERFAAKPYSLEIANGNGVTGLAKKLRYRLARQGMPAARLTNLKPYKETQTMVQYRGAYHEEALRLSSKLRVAARLVQDDNMRKGIDVRLVLGKDMGSRVAGNEEDALLGVQLASRE
jgi:hypothetical protein